MIEDAWKNFELSGKISDYLTYRQHVGEETNKTDNSTFFERGMGSYGTERGSDGNGVKCNADWRI